VVLWLRASPPLPVSPELPEFPEFASLITDEPPRPELSP